MVHEPSVNPTAQPSLGKLEGKTPLVLFLVLALTIGAVGYAIFAHLEEAIRQEKYHELGTVGDLKVSQIVGWLDERRGDAAATTRDPILAREVQRWLQRGAPHDEAARRIESRLQGLREAYSYDKVILLDRATRPALVAGDALHQHADAASNQRAPEAMSAGQPLLSDLHLEAETEGAPAQVNIDLYAPLLEDGRRVVGTVYFQIDPYRFLFPFIQSWPTSSKSAETLLVRRDGDDVLYLNELRHHKDSPLRFRLPLNTPDLPAAKSLRGETGVIEGVDYRGVPVLAALRTIPGTSWHMVAKIDQAEVFAPARNLAIGVGAIVAVLIAGAGLLVTLWWRKQHAQFLAMQFKAELKHEALSKHLDLMSRHANDAIFLYDEAGGILEANERAVERYGYPRDELIGMSANQLRAPGAALGARKEAQLADEAGSRIYETLHRRKDGSEFPVEASLRVVDVEGRRLTQGIIRDITERKRAEATLRESEERYRVIAESASDVILVIDEDSRIRFTSPAVENMFGYVGAELIGQPLTILIPEDLRSAHLEALKRYIGTGRRSVNWKGVELRGRHKSGTQFPVEIAFGEFVQDGKRAFAGYVRDISERKRAEARIARLAGLKDALSRVNHAIVHAKNEQPLFDEVCAIVVERAGFEYAGIGIADLDSGEIRWVAGAGAAAATLAQVRRTVRADQPEGRGLTGIAVRERRHVVSQDFLIDPLTAPWHKLGRKLGIGSAATFPIVRAGAAVGVVNVYSHAREAFDNEMVALLDEAAQDVSFALDNFDRERARRKAKARATELLSIVNRSPAVFIKWNTSDERPVELVSENIAQFGHSPEEFISGALKYVHIVHPEDRARFIEERKRAERDGQPIVVREYRICTRDGDVRWVEDRTWMHRDPAGHIAHYQGLVQDITQRKAAERKIEYETRRYKALLDTAIDGIHIVDRNGYLVECNPAFLRMLGYEKDEALGLHITDWDAQLRAEEIAAKIASLRGGSEIIETKHRRKDGSVRDVEVSISGIELEGESYFYCAARDITERKQNEADLRAAEERFRGLVEQSISGIYIIQDGRFAYVNPRAAEIFGYAAPVELVGREPADFVAEKDRGLVAENIRRRLAGEVKSIAYTFTGLRKDGTTVEIGAHGSLATYRGRPAIISAAQDITERKRSEEEAQRHLAELQQAMMATVRVASSMSEMRDPYTSGHERRVGELSAAIGAELSLSEHQVEGLRVAGYLHDIGKIVVPSEILAKPGKITSIEFALIKEHARQGYEILKEVSFPWPVALVALQHHERFNGTGYPQGLKGDEIIPEARIIAVADTIEAMASHRPYRPGLGIEAALAAIERGGGEHYCQLAVDACLRLFRDKGYRLPS